MLLLCSSSPLNCYPQTFSGFFCFLENTILSAAIYRFCILMKQKNTALFCFLSDVPHNLKSYLYVRRIGSLLLFALSNMKFIYVIKHSMFNLFIFIFWCEATYDQTKKSTM